MFSIVTFMNKGPVLKALLYTVLSFIARQDLPIISSVSSKHFSIITGRNSKIPCFSCAAQSNEHQFGPVTRHRSLRQSLHVGNESLHALIDYLSGWSFQQRTPFHCEHCKVYNCHTSLFTLELQSWLAQTYTHLATL